VHVAVPTPGQHIIDAQSSAQDTGSLQTDSIKWHQARKGLYKIWKTLKKPPPFLYRFMESMEIQALKVAQSTVDDPQAVEAGCTAEVVFFQ
jgi:hypothetical protein